MVAADFWDVEAQLLRFENFSHAASVRTLESAAARSLNPCDSHSQRALLIMELSLADADLRSKATSDFDRRVQSLETRTRRILSCTPRDSFAWLVAFGLETARGVSTHSFDLLAASYETSPREAWVGLRRMIVAIPLTLSAPEHVQRMILDEFEHLVRHRFVEIPARLYFNAPADVRALLDSRIEQLSPSSKRLFSEELGKLRS
ncbi:hypothetical protein [Bradyrhizobium sp. BWA-3-5]|uniref:hypothetical protein n=1 Tax=Bradyrhizobium sp. BWA-3-5 TaxID=3080013 RepID=UPI00293E0913|nr:hypothetical protein [Bradyrhizobium sp. BWA-3-5]WOH68035.1 hypothetical protein RX331_10095 [Bradyrhizobium sp. BWA-3-5]